MIVHLCAASCAAYGDGRLAADGSSAAGALFCCTDAVSCARHARRDWAFLTYGNYEYCCT